MGSARNEHVRGSANDLVPPLLGHWQQHFFGVGLQIVQISEHFFGVGKPRLEHLFGVAESMIWEHFLGL